MEQFPPKEMDIGKKETISAQIKDFLLEQPAVLFAYVHGSFAEGRPFRDVDVATYVDPGAYGTGEELFAYSLRLGAETDLAVPGITIDVKLLNEAPIPFQFRVISNGHVLFSRDENTRVEFETRTRVLYFDFHPHRKVYRRELLGLGD
jgi:hypothetical protein